MFPPGWIKREPVTVFSLHGAFVLSLSLSRCFCLRCWHSNTNYTWNITPTHKNSLLSYVRWDPCWCLLSFAFFPFTNLAQRRPDIPGPRSLPRCASSAVFHWGECCSLFSPFSQLVSTSYCLWHLLHIHFPTRRLEECNWFTSHRRAPESSTPRGNHWRAPKPRRHRSLSGFTLHVQEVTLGW